MTKHKKLPAIALSELSIANETYQPPQQAAQGKYDEILRRAKQGQRIVCPLGRENTIAHAYRSFLKKHLGVKDPIIRTKSVCADGLSGVWWLGEKEDEPVAAPAAKPVKTMWQKLEQK